MDGHFVPNLTFGPPVIKKLRPHTKLPFDVHLMITNPEMSVEDYARAGADSITIHAEATIHLHRTLSQLRELKVDVGVSLNPATPISAIQHILHLVDLVLVMTVNPGFGGQSFIAETMPKVRALRDLAQKEGNNFLIQVDGGIDKNTVQEASLSGAQNFVAGSAIFRQKDYKQAIREIRENANRSPWVPSNS